MSTPQSAFHRGAFWRKFFEYSVSVGVSVHCTEKEPIPKIRNKYSQKTNGAATVKISTFMCLWAIYILPPHRAVCLPRVPQCLSPRLNWDPLTPLRSDCALPPEPGGYTVLHTRLRVRGGGVSQFGRLEKNLSTLSIVTVLCAPNTVLSPWI